MNEFEYIELETLIRKSFDKGRMFSTNGGQSEGYAVNDEYTIKNQYSKYLHYYNKIENLDKGVISITTNSLDSFCSFFIKDKDSSDIFYIINMPPFSSHSFYVDFERQELWVYESGFVRIERKKLNNLTEKQEKFGNIVGYLLIIFLLFILPALLMVIFLPNIVDSGWATLISLIWLFASVSVFDYFTRGKKKKATEKRSAFIYGYSMGRTDAHYENQLENDNNE